MQTYQSILHKTPGGEGRAIQAFATLMMRTFPPPGPESALLPGHHWVKLNWEAREETLTSSLFSGERRWSSRRWDLREVSRVSTYHQVAPDWHTRMRQQLRKGIRCERWSSFAFRFAILGVPVFAILALTLFFGSGRIGAGIVAVVALVVLGIASAVAHFKLRRQSHRVVEPDLFWIADSPFVLTGLSDYTPEPLANSGGLPRFYKCCHDASEEASTISLSQIPTYLHVALDVTPAEYHRALLHRRLAWTLAVAAIIPSTILLWYLFTSNESGENTDLLEALFLPILLPFGVYLGVIGILPEARKMSTMRMKTFPTLRAFLAGRRVVR